MDISGITDMATALSEMETRQEVGVSVLKKALQIEKNTAATLLAAIPAPPNLPAHLGRNVNTVA